jgi:MoxR-like ATPase
MAKTVTTTAAEEWDPRDLRDEAEALRGRINRFRASLGRFLVAKQELIFFMVVAAVARCSRASTRSPGPRATARSTTC